MKRLLLAGLLGCAAGPAALPNGNADASASPTAPATSAAPGRVSHREELLREATTTGLDVVFAGWLESASAATASASKDLGAASADTCVRIRVAAPLPTGVDAGATSHTLTLTEHEGDQARTTAFSVHDVWLPPYCVRRGARLTVAAGVPVEVVVVASAAFR